MAKFRIEGLTDASPRPRLLTMEVLTSGDFNEVAKVLGIAPVKARKIGFIAARRTLEPVTIETRWNGKESIAAAAPGDWIAVNMTPDRKLMRDGDGELNVYVIRADRFPDLYAPDDGSTAHGDIYRAVSEVEAIHFPGGFEIMAPCGELQRAPAGYLLSNGTDVYGNAEQTFLLTYRIVCADDKRV